MSQKAKAWLLFWLSILCFITTVICLFKWFALAFTAGDAIEAAKAGVPYTAEQLNEFRHLSDIASLWFGFSGAAVVCGCISMYFAVKKRRTIGASNDS